MKKYIKTVFWCVLALVLCLSYEQISNIIFGKINYFDVKFGIIPDVLLPSVNAVVDTFISLVLIAIYLILAIFIVKRHDERVKIGLFKGIIFGIVMGFAFYGIAGLWFEIVDRFLVVIPFIAKNSEYFSGVYSDLESGDYIWSLLSISIVGPVVEEILFRLLVFNSLERVTKNPWFAIIVSGVAFGVWHMIFVQSVYTAIMGCMMGLIYYKTRNIFITMFIHIFNNTIGNLPATLNTDVINNAITAISYIMIIPAIVLLVVLWNTKPERNEQSPYRL
ncbi:CAAX protease self-immunity [Lachnoanaerobaculum saburreum F0468]|uniref:CAAX protease self-immunity n=1 Tax=Lachnoanaerobaculum saburreum F0468 TaxID=1095750 RepID=I0R5P9_9FIRM|nr:type II CAAX endopeptidase family protein [Lachnoanaerobaculum saburreum]EIC95007.1 CAAX protease self-immunity [Lachnoanaerobaculum saburreum F0468]